MGLTAVLAVAGLLFVTSAEASRTATLRNDGTDVASLVSAERTRFERKTAEVRRLSQTVESLTAAQAQTNEVVGALSARFDAMAAQAGLGPVTGPGYRVQLNDAPPDSARREGVRPDELVVHQQDVQAVVNALWRGGASALMVMDQRVIATSAIRCVGNTLILQGRVYSPPYTISAIGVESSLRKALAESPEVGIYREYVDLLGLEYRTSTFAKQTFPAYAEAVNLRFAAPVTEQNSSAEPAEPARSGEAGSASTSSTP